MNQLRSSQQKFKSLAIPAPELASSWKSGKLHVANRRAMAQVWFLEQPGAQGASSSALADPV